MAIVPHVPQNGITAPPSPSDTTANGFAPTVNDLLDRYLRDLVSLKAAGTASHYAQIYTVLRHEIGTLALSAVTPAHLRALRESLLPRYGPGTTRKYLYALSGAFTAAVKEYDWLTENPFRRIRVPTPPPARVRFLSEAERPRLLQACQASGNRALYSFVLLALCTGARRNELRYLRWRDVNLTHGTLTFARTKNGEARTVPVVGLALQVLRGWRVGHRHPEAWIFPREQDDLEPVVFDSAFRRAVQRAGIPNFHLHDLRHTCASYLGMSGASLRDIAEVLGHKSLSVTAKYTHLLLKHTVGVVQRMATEFALDHPGAVQPTACPPAEGAPPPPGRPARGPGAARTAGAPPLGAPYPGLEPA